MGALGFWVSGAEASDLFGLRLVPRGQRPWNCTIPSLAGGHLVSMNSVCFWTLAAAPAVYAAREFVAFSNLTPQYLTHVTLLQRATVVCLLESVFPQKVPPKPSPLDGTGGWGLGLGPRARALAKTSANTVRLRPWLAAGAAANHTKTRNNHPGGGACIHSCMQHRRGPGSAESAQSSHSPYRYSQSIEF